MALLPGRQPPGAWVPAAEMSLDWLKRRIPLLEQEKALTRHRDLVYAERSRLPPGFVSRRNMYSMVLTEG